MSTKIEWCDETWNPITGCTPISEGCENCYAERMSKRLKGRFGYPKDDPFKVVSHDLDTWHKPLKWKKKRKIFVCSMGDLFHHDVKEREIDRVYTYMFDSPHIFMILTKRPNRMRDYFAYKWRPNPPDNLWLGVTAENQDTANVRLPILLDIPVDVRFVSVEPMLESIDLASGAGVTYWDDPSAGIDWVICGGETGPGAREIKKEWVQGLRDDVIGAGIPFFFKSWGAVRQEEDYREDEFHNYVDSNRLLDGEEWTEFPREEVE